MKKKTVYKGIKEIIYEFDEFDVKQLILSKVNLSDSDSKTMTFTYTYKVNSDLNGAIVKIVCDKKEEIRGVREGERKGKSKSKWVLLPIGGIERLTCDCCYKTVKQQDMHICRTNGSMKVLCGKCWEEVEEK